MNEQQLISIIITIYNTEKFLRKCIESILNQSYRNLEIILVNDGSKDSSGKICDEYAAKDSRIVVIHQENKGMSLSRYAGIQAAKGEYLSFVDSDDWVESHFIEYMYNLVVKYDAEVACCNVVKDYPTGKAVRDIDLDNVVLCNSVEVIKKTNERIFKPYIVNKLFKKELWKDVVFKQNVTIGEDYRACMQIFVQCKKIVLGSEVLYHYIQHIKSSCYRGYEGNGNAILDSYTEIKEMLNKHYPNIKQSILRYWVLEELAVIVSMVKSNFYDENVIKRVQKDLRSVWKEYIFIKEEKLYIKLCFVLAVIHYKLLTIPYKCFFTGRYKIEMV